MASARILHVLDQQSPGEQRKAHRIADDERKDKQQKYADAYRPENHTEFPGGNLFDPFDRGLHLFKVILSGKGVSQLGQGRRILAVFIQGHPEKGRNGIPFYKVEHLARKMPTEIRQCGIGTDKGHRVHVLGMLQAVSDDPKRIGIQRLRQESFHRIEVLFHGKNTDDTPEYHERGRQQ